MELWEKISEMFETGGMTLHGNRIGVLRDDPEEKYKSDVVDLVVPESYKRTPLTGKVVCFGKETTLFADGNMSYGDSVSFNKYNSVSFEITVPGEQTTCSIDVLHVSDIYLSWKGE